MQILILRIKKLLYCIAHINLWYYLVRGISPTIEHNSALGTLKVRKVLDVGANRGQFALFARRKWPQADIVCFEPLPWLAKELKQTFNGLPISIIQSAVSDWTGRSDMYVTSRDDSSSLLPFGTTQSDISKTTLDHIEREIDVETLDNLLKHDTIPTATLLKIDVQGLEDKVLLGASESLRKIEWIYVECSFTELYINQKLASWVISYLDTQGFELAGIYNQASDRKIGAIQADFLFRSRKAER
jgi:FkbM family methyltransferase